MRSSARSTSFSHLQGGGKRAIYIVSGALGVFVRLKVVHLEKISKTSVASERGHFSI